jgi:branched-chain amino acid transport system permease protein
VAAARSPATEIGIMTDTRITSQNSTTGKAGLLWHTLPWVIAVAFFFIAEGYLSLGTQIIIWILFTMSLDLVLGYAGIVTLGHAALFGFGAYCAGILSIHFTGNPLSGLLITTVLTGLVGFVSGILILHTTGVTFLMLTLAILSMLFEYANRATKLTGGDDGLQGMKIEPLLGQFEFTLFGHTAYVYSLIVLFVWFVIAWRIVHSPFGRSLDGIRQNPKRMRAIGTPVWWRLVVIYTISSAMAGSAGALLAYQTRFVGLSVLSLFTSGIVAVMLILGGTRRIYGAFVGAAIYVVVQDYSAKINPHLWEFVIGGMLIVVVLFLEDGLMSIPKLIKKLMSRRAD